MPTPDIELPVATQQEINVVIYQVNYSDLDANGQVESSELPTFDDVLRQDLDPVQDRVRSIDPAKAGEIPTQEDIEREKNELLSDPNQPSGAYAIIKEDSEGNRTVLDVFGIRDWPEEAQDTDEEPAAEVVVPKLEPFDPDAIPPKNDSEPDAVPPPPADLQSYNGIPDAVEGRVTRLHSANSESRLASSGLLIGSLLMLRSANKQDLSAKATSTSEPSSDAAPIGYGRRARRLRSLHR